jgi:septal ring factor EnvC (AmiA/AmiB activator)
MVIIYQDHDETNGINILSIPRTKKKNSKLADSLRMQVEKFAKMEERISSVQKVNTDLQRQLEAMAKRLRVFETKSTENVPSPRTTYLDILIWPSSSFADKHQTF